MASIKSPVDCFIRDVLNNYDLIIAEEPKKYKRAQPLEVALAAQQVYVSTIQSPTDFVLIGDRRIRDSEVMAQNFGLLTEANNQGAIFAGKKWTVLKNDAFVLGTINAQKVVYLAMDSFPVLRSLYNDEGKLNPLGREIAMFLAAGYKPFKTPFCIGFAPPCDERSFSLKSLWKKIAGHQGIELLDQILKDSQDADDFKSS